MPLLPLYAGGTLWISDHQDVREAIDISESTLYPVLRRFKRMAVLKHTTVKQADEPPYYRATRKGNLQLKVYIEAGAHTRNKLNKFF
jgi:PadR family transcriptional regulator PadR